MQTLIDKRVECKFLDPGARARGLWILNRPLPPRVYGGVHFLEFARSGSPSLDETRSLRVRANPNRLLMLLIDLHSKVPAELLTERSMRDPLVSLRWISNGNFFIGATPRELLSLSLNPWIISCSRTCLKNNDKLSNFTVKIILNKLTANCQ